MHPIRHPMGFGDRKKISKWRRPCAGTYLPFSGGEMEGKGFSTGPGFPRRSFLSRAWQWSALFAAYPLIPLPGLGESLAADSRVAQTPVVDKGFASVRKVGEGLY